MERKFVVIPLGMSGKGNKVFKSGDVVAESQLNRPVQDLIKEGFIKELESEYNKSQQSEVNNDVTNSEDDKEPLFIFKTDSGDEIKVFCESDVTKKQLINLMDAKEMEFDSSRTKAILFDQYIKSLEE